MANLQRLEIEGIYWNSSAPKCFGKFGKRDFSVFSNLTELCISRIGQLANPTLSPTLLPGRGLEALVEFLNRFYREENQKNPLFRIPKIVVRDEREWTAEVGSNFVLLVAWGWRCL